MSKYKTGLHVSLPVVSVIMNLFRDKIFDKASPKQRKTICIFALFIHFFVTGKFLDKS